MDENNNAFHNYNYVMFKITSFCIYFLKIYIGCYRDFMDYPFFYFSYFYFLFFLSIACSKKSTQIVANSAQELTGGSREPHHQLHLCNKAKSCLLREGKSLRI